MFFIVFAVMRKCLEVHWSVMFFSLTGLRLLQIVQVLEQSLLSLLKIKITVLSDLHEIDLSKNLNFSLAI